MSSSQRNGYTKISYQECRRRQLQDINQLLDESAVDERGDIFRDMIGVGQNGERQ